MQTGKRSTLVVPEVLSAYDGQIPILEAAGLNGVCTDHNLTVLKAFGDTTAYLKNKNFIFDLGELLPNDVSVVVKAAAHLAWESHQPVRLSSVDFGSSRTHDQHTVNILINPFFTGEPATRQLLVVFTTNKRKVKDKFLITSRNVSRLTGDYLDSLERDLAEAKKNLATAYELINSSNENIQSYNEELQSANEEMHSANEELQSVNEELQTINKEQEQTNADLTESNDDLNNYFRSNTNGQLFVDQHMLLKRYSPGAVQHINLRESDVGRPLNHITTNIKFQTLIADIKKVILDGETITREAESTDGKIYQVMIMPYIRQNLKTTGGAAISFYDITELKKLMGLSLEQG